MRKISEKDRAARWLEEQLQDGPKVSRDLYANATKIELSKSMLLRAAKDMDVVSISKPGEFGRITVWHLPEQVPEDVRDLAR